MKKIEALIKPFKLEEVKKALLQAGCEGLTMEDISVTALKNEAEGPYRALLADSLGNVPRTKLTLVVPDHGVDVYVHAISAAARCGQGRIDDGIIFVSAVQEAIRIRTEELDEAAL